MPQRKQQKTKYRQQVTENKYNSSVIIKKAMILLKMLKKIRIFQQHASKITIGMLSIFIASKYFQVVFFWLVKWFTNILFSIFCYETIVQLILWLGDEASVVFYSFWKDCSDTVGSTMVPRRVVVIILFFITAFVKVAELEQSSIQSSSPWEKDSVLRARVTKCYDGDTCTVELHGNLPHIFKHIPVRVAGIDTPEIRGKCKEEKMMAVKAREITQNFVVNKEVKLINVQRDKYFRIVADILTKEGDLAEHLLNSDMAVPYDGGTKHSLWCN